MDELTKTIELQKYADGMATFSIANEGVVDKDGDMFRPGSIRLDREKATLASFNHGQTPVGTWELSRVGDQVLATAKFLDTPEGQATRAYVAEMGQSAQFSFRGRVVDYERTSEAPGMVFKDVLAYEASPVFVGAGDTELLAVKSKQDEGSGETDSIRSKVWAILNWSEVS